ncbi:hypothetical protein THAOC_23839, partial [Thalassiosira oceanica]
MLLTLLSASSGVSVLAFLASRTSRSSLGSRSGPIVWARAVSAEALSLGCLSCLRSSFESLSTVSIIVPLSRSQPASHVADDEARMSDRVQPLSNDEETTPPPAPLEDENDDLEQGRGPREVEVITVDV